MEVPSKEGFDRPSAVGEAVLLARRKLGEGLALAPIRREDGVESKPLCTAGFERDSTLDFSRENGGLLAGFAIAHG